jgi:hypothetical protein
MEKSTKKIIITLSIILTVISVLLAGTILLVMELSKVTYTAVILDRADGAPIEGARVEIEKITYDEVFYFHGDMIPTTRSHVRTIHSDEEGRFSIRLPGINEDRGYYYFRISAEGFVPDHVPSYEYPENDHSSHYSDDLESVIYFNSVCSLIGNVTDPTGTPIPGATVVFWPDNIGLNPHDVDQAASTDINGRFYLDHVRVGPGTLRVDAPFFERITIRSMSLTGSETNCIDIVLRRVNSTDAKVSGTITFDQRYIDLDGSNILLIFSEYMINGETGERFFTMVEGWGFEIHLGHGTYVLGGAYLDFISDYGWFEIHTVDPRWSYRTIEVFEDMELEMGASVYYVDY